jgi:hypothetical protein
MTGVLGPRDDAAQVPDQRSRVATVWLSGVDHRSGRVGGATAADDHFGAEQARGLERGAQTVG